MTPKAGSGLQPAAYERGQLLILTGDDITGVSITRSIRTPDGSWWKLNTASILLDATAAAFPVTYSLLAVYNARALFRAVGLNQIPAGTFAGNILWGRGLTPQENVNQAMLVGQLPDLWLPPSTNINLSLQGVAGSCTMSEIILTLQSAYNEPTP